MSKPVLSNAAGTQPIPGYTLRKRLGAGGYGEVWLADAPGGLTKAVKLIYGNVDESRASSELRSLERIRRASHPFLLSIERIEVVQGKVIIVTELAESSLHDRFESFRRQNLPGIPRTELLDFLRDTADALDYLAQKHSLQHLDVKPGNLLIVADRIKVADFGLVKDLHDSNQSLVGGLTPTYSAPEVFDGRPNFRSDQYSLAIVYMEMLTGRMPFKGSSAGELARQHLNQAPDLEPLPPADRNIIRRALSKNPLDRYSSCRQFIDQLIKIRSSVVPIVDSPERSNSSPSEPPTPTRATGDTKDWTSGQQQFFHNRIPVEKLASQWFNARAMFIGVGGQGVLALRELRRDLIHNVDDRFNCEDHEWLAIDTSREEMEEVITEGGIERLPWDCAFELPVQSPHSYRKFDPGLFAPLSRRWLYNIPRSQKTEGVRPIATLSLIAHYPMLRSLVEKKLANLIKNHQADKECNSPLNIYVISSMHGGTGAALIAEIGMMVRESMTALNFTNYRISATLSVATTSNCQIGANLPSANALALLSELTHWMDPARERPQIDHRTGFATSCICPFEWVTLVDGGLFEDRAAKVQNPKNLARIVALDCQTLSSSALSESRRVSPHVGPLGWLRSACAATIQDIPELTTEIIAQWCCLQTLQSTRRYLAGRSEEAADRVKDDSNISSASQSHLPLTDEACVEFTRRLLKELGFCKSADEIFHCDQSIAQWVRRISPDPQIRHTQLALDMSIWRSAISRIIEMRVYNWPQVTHVQLKAMEGLQAFTENQVPFLVQQFQQHSCQLGKPANIQKSVHNYLLELGQACIKVFESINAEATKTLSRFERWWQTLQNDSAAMELLKIERTALPPMIQHLGDRVKLMLEYQFSKSLLARLEIALAKNDLEIPSDSQCLQTPDSSNSESYSQMLMQAFDLVNACCKELSLSPEDFRGGVYHHSTVSIKEAVKYQPPLASGGGELFRVIIANDEQSDRVTKSIEKLGILEKTTLLPGTQSLGVHLLCDAVQLSIPQMVSSLWRPTGATLSLAERLRTRVDIEWDPVSSLLDWKQSRSTTVKNEPTNETLSETANENGVEQTNSAELEAAKALNQLDPIAASPPVVSVPVDAVPVDGAMGNPPKMPLG